ncbi:protein TRC8 homolog [Palaemon carinicauda]|uniref:protein TRC8 homolog n=1 Tax=Palaemon carinicauda TaxID=392227 RepID=UPI0035B666D5
METEEWDFFKRVGSRVKRRYLDLESLYMEMKNASVLVNQIVFFSLCERIFLSPDQRMASLYTLMFFNVIAYCASYVKEIIEREDWSMYVNITRSSNVHHLALSTTKIVLEWTKAVTFIITVVFMLLVFGLEKGLKNYTPTVTYLLITGFYFIMTEKVFVEMFFSWLDYRKFDYFEGMETFYCPALLLAMQITISFLFLFLCFVYGNFRLVVLSSFTNVRVKYRELQDRYLIPLSKELSKLSCYRMATPSEIRGHDDVCAVCLTAMSCARITPCQHFFHADCLRRCLKESYKCPICQYDLFKSQSIISGQ